MRVAVITKKFLILLLFFLCSKPADVTTSTSGRSRASLSGHMTCTTSHYSPLENTAASLAWQPWLTKSLPSSTGDSSSSKYNLVGYKYNVEGSVSGHSLFRWNRPFLQPSMTDKIANGVKQADISGKSGNKHRLIVCCLSSRTCCWNQ